MKKPGPRSRWVFLALVLNLAPTAAFAEQPPAGAQAPTRESLQALIKGNSIEGVWAGRRYQQYFAAHGATDYRETGGSLTHGRWRINPQGQYCSVWPPSPSEACYEVRVLDNAIYWRAGESFYPSRVIEGNVFSP